jgi:hypothetical protein
MRAPTFVATFKDGAVTRMSIYCKKESDWSRGKRIAAHAWQTRDRRHRIEEFLATHDRYEHRHQMEEFLTKLEDREPSEIASCHFDVDGQMVLELTEDEPVQ